MKAIRISTREEVEVSSLTYTQIGTGIVHRRDKKSGMMIPESDLDFTPAPEKTTIEGWVMRDDNNDIALFLKSQLVMKMEIGI